MSAVLVQRQLALTGLALLAALAALAIAGRDSDQARVAPRLPEPAAPDSAWYGALAGVRARSLSAKPSACGYRLGPRIVGVEHPVLPCGAKLFVRYGERTVLTQVLDRGPSAPGREFDLTPALADLLGVHGVQPIRWTFARTP